MANESKKYTKLYGPGRLSDGGIPGGKFWITDNKSYTIFDPRNSSEVPILPKEKKKFNFPLLSRGLSCLLAIIILTSSLHDGTFRFIEGYKVNIEYNEYDCEFYNYDWTFKFKQLSRLRPMFSVDSLFNSDKIHNVSQMNPNDYYIEFKNLYDEGAIYFSGVNNTGKTWLLNSNYDNYIYAEYIYNYRFYSTGLSELMGGTLARNYLAYSDSEYHVAWINQEQWFRDYEKSISGGFPFWDSVVVVLTIPEKLTFNIIVLLDFLMRW